MISKADCKMMIEYYSQLIAKLTKAKIALIDGGVKSYTIDDRTLTRFDIDTLGVEIENAVRKKAEYEALLNGKSRRRAFGVVIRDT